MAREKGSGYIFKRGNIYYAQFKVNGKQKVVSLHTSKKDEAKVKAAELTPLTEANTKERIALYVAEAKKLVSSNSILLLETWEKYLKSARRHDTCEKTVANQKARWEKFQEWLSKAHIAITTMAQVTEEISAEYAAHIWADGMAAKTYNDHIATLRMIFAALEKDAGIPINPFRAANIGKKEEDHKTRRELSETELLALLAAPDAEGVEILNREEMKVLLHIGAWAGLRLKDAALLRWDDVNFEMGQLSVVPSKTRRNKMAVIIPLHPSLAAELERARAWIDDSGYVLPKVAERYGKNPAGIVKDIGRLFRQAGIETTVKAEKGSRRKLKVAVAGFHSLRHSFVSFCAKKGVPLAIVQSLVGHGNPAMTRHYTHLGADSARQAIAALPVAVSDKDRPEAEETIRLRQEIEKLSSSASMATLREVLSLLEQNVSSQLK